MSDISSINGLNDGFSEHYTPTTEKMLEAWIEYKCMSDCEECPAEFDRWLAEVKADAWQEGYTAGKPYPQLVSKNPYWQGENID